MSTTSLDFIFTKTVQRKVAVVVTDSWQKSLSEALKSLQPDKVFIVADEHVANHYGHKVTDFVGKTLPVSLISHPAGEEHKNLKYFSQMVETFFKEQGSERSCICALGGGITGNIAGLMAALIYRGIHLVHLPTTLLAQLDSAADVKQSVNSQTIKNSVGAYKAPDFVIIDPHFLHTLPQREIRSGLAEAIKHGFAQDVTLLQQIADLALDDQNEMQKIIERTIQLKIDHWKNTSTMWNEKIKTEKLTHLGHTVGKILEMIDVGWFTHGEAISHGMVIEFYISHLMGMMSKEQVELARQYLEEQALLPRFSPAYTTDRIIAGLFPKEDSQPLFALLPEFANPQTISCTVAKKLANQAVIWYWQQIS